jgi:hypothetical protein
VLFTFDLITQNDVVLGNFRFNTFESALYAGFWVTVLFWAMWDYVYVRKININKTKGQFWIFWTMNFVSFWLVSRFSHIAGFGISSYWWALLIGLVANFVQRFAWMMVTGKDQSEA